MSNLTRLALLLLPLAACVTNDDSPDSEDIDDAISEEDAGKADEVQAYKHYLLYQSLEEPTLGTLVRAGGGKLRCPDDVVRDSCDITEGSLSPTLGFKSSPAAVFAGLPDHPVIIQGRLVRVTGEDRVYLRASTLTRSLTSVVPYNTTCYRIKQVAPLFSYEKLDSTANKVTADMSYFDEVDPTPDFWGQPTADVQELIDRALELSTSQRVLACGTFEKRDAKLWFWTAQVFATL